MRQAIAVLSLLVSMAFVCPQTVAAQCCGDCDGDGVVAIANLVTAVRNALDGCPTAAPCCGDCNGDDSVGVNELITAVNLALGSCDAISSPTPSETPTHTATATLTASSTSTPTETPTATPSFTPTLTNTPVRAVDHGDGTLADLTTGLMWEKKIGGDGVPDGSNDQDVDNRYAWLGTCQNTSVDCRTNDDCDVAIPCLAGDQQGTRLNVFTFVIRLNARQFAGYDDWRVPSLDELRSLRDLDERPSIDPGFHAPGCGTACLDLGDPDCNCTSAQPYWTADEDPSDAGRAFRIDFDDGAVRASNKRDRLRIRAVRGP